MLSQWKKILLLKLIWNSFDYALHHSVVKPYTQYMRKYNFPPTFVQKIPVLQLIALNKNRNVWFGFEWYGLHFCKTRATVVPKYRITVVLKTKSDFLKYAWYLKFKFYLTIYIKMLKKIHLFIIHSSSSDLKVPQTSIYKY